MTVAKKDNYLYGIFLREEKNRFLAKVKIKENEISCYVPSSCKLSSLIDMTGRAVILKPVNKPNARTHYSVYALKYRNTFIPINLTYTNKIIEDQIQRRFFSFLGVRDTIQRECKLGNYKTDLFIHNTNTLIEIKSILTFSREATFPAMYSERAIKQLKEISKLLDKGYHACYVLVALSPSIREITINRVLKDYYNIFIECIQKGMTYCAFSVRLHNYTPEIHSKIKVNV